MTGSLHSAGTWLLSFLGWKAPPPNQYPTFSKIDRVGIARYVTIDSIRWINIPLNRYDLEDSQADRMELVRTIYETLSHHGIRYVTEVYQPTASTQVVRAPGAMLEHPKEGTCLDLATLFSGIALASGLLPIIVICKGHAFVLVSVSESLERWNRLGRKGLPLFKEAMTADKESLLALVKEGALVPVECTGFASSSRLQEISQAQYPESVGRKNGLLSFENAVRAGESQLNLVEREFQYAVDIASAHFQWGIRPHGIPQLPQQITADRARAFSRMIIGLAFFAVAAIYLLFALLDSADSLANRLERDVLTDRSVNQFPDTLPEYTSWVKRSVDRRLTKRVSEIKDVTETREQVRIADQNSRAHIWRWIYSGTYPRGCLSNPSSAVELTTRSSLIAHAPQARVSAESVLSALKDPGCTSSERQALLLLLGDCDLLSFDKAHKNCSVFGVVTSAFEKDDDPGVHAAAWWLLANRFEQRGQAELEKLQGKMMEAGIDRIADKGITGPTWYVDPTCGITMVVFPSGQTFTMGNSTPTLGPSDEQADQRLNPLPHRVAIPRMFAISMTEITEKQFGLSGITPKDKSYGDDYARSSSWEHAAKFCNWMSGKQHLSPCYTEVEDASPVYKKDYNGLRHAPNTNHLKANGYRLPTESEWEFAAKGCSHDMPSLSYSCGNDFNLLHGYASFTGFREIVASKRPNAFGLFDCLGGLSELCDDNSSPYRDGDRNRAHDDQGVSIEYANDLGKMRIIRGGSFASGNPARALTVYRRGEWGQRVPSNTIGFRIARTIVLPLQKPAQ